MASQKILIVDDEPFNVDYLEQELEETGCEIISAGNGQEALYKVSSEVPDLVLLDIMMPVLDGFEVLSRLKADPATRDIPVIVISANNDIRSVVKGIQLGAEDYLPKPFEPTLLNARIKSSLEKKRLHDLEHLYLKSMEREFEIAREIQMSFLPSELPVLDGWKIDAYFKAAREVAGDFYDSFILPDGNLVCVIGDVCGKGVGAALFMTLFRSLIRATVTSDLFCDGKNMNSFSPAERLLRVISFTNQYITETHEEAKFATVFISLFNPQSGMLTYINCGNEPPLLLGNDGNITTLLPTGPVVGVMQDAIFSVKEISMKKNDLLLVYTDGIPDALNKDGISFGNDLLMKLFNDNKLSPDMLIKKIVGQLDKFIGETDQFDDITMVAIKREL